MNDGCVVVADRAELPMLPDQWNAVFRRANLRCERALLTGAEREVPRVAEIRGRAPYATVGTEGISGIARRIR